MEQLLADSNIDNLEEGSIIKGTIVEIRPTEVVVDIGGKSEGVVHASEFVDMSDLQVGSELEVFLEKQKTKKVTRLSPTTKPSRRRTGRKSSRTAKRVRSFKVVSAPRLKAA